CDDLSPTPCSCGCADTEVCDQTSAECVPKLGVGECLQGGDCAQGETCEFDSADSLFGACVSDSDAVGEDEPATPGPVSTTPDGGTDTTSGPELNAAPEPTPAPEPAPSPTEQPPEP